MGNPFDSFDGIEDEKMDGSGSGIYFKPGKYPLLRIQQCKFKEAKKSYKGSDAFIALIEVIESNVPERGPGTIIDYVVKQKKKDGSPNTFYFKNIKKLLMAAFNTDDPADIDKKLIQLCCDAQQAASGKYVSAVATNIDLEGGGIFTGVDFKPESGSDKAASSASA